MNNLSWFLYLADVFPSMATLFIVMASVGIGCLALYLFGVAMYNSEVKYTEDKVEINGKTIFKSISVASLLYLVSALIPSKETIYLIAGSEAGEAVVTSESGQEILDDIHQVIRHQLTQLKESSE